MPLLDPAATSSPQSPTPPASSKAITITKLPKLKSPPDEHFLKLKPLAAGRAVVLEIYPPRFVHGGEIQHLCDKHSCENAQELGIRMGIFHIGSAQRVGWLRWQEKIDFPTLGSAAQALERAGVNWRQATTHIKIIEEAANMILP